jgi:alpha-tubulin suppressor-like RCC1 family protein
MRTATETAAAWQGHSLGENIDVLTTVTGGLTGKRVVSVALGPFQGASATTDGEVFMWGSGFVKPMLVEGALTGKRVLSVSGCDGFTLALTDAGEIWVWGRGSHGSLPALGLGSIDQTDSPTRVEGGFAGKRVVGISACFSHCAAVTAGGKYFRGAQGSMAALDMVIRRT